jgi:hypothetical protein
MRIAYNQYPFAVNAFAIIRSLMRVMLDHELAYALVMRDVSGNSHARKERSIRQMTY